MAPAGSVSGFLAASAASIASISASDAAITGRPNRGLPARMMYVPGSRPKLRNSPRSLVVA